MGPRGPRRALGQLLPPMRRKSYELLQGIGGQQLPSGNAAGAGAAEGGGPRSAGEEWGNVG